jgi:beta-galactosidase
MRRLVRPAAALVLIAGSLTAGSLAIAGGPARAAGYTPPAPRQRVDLNAGWKFLRSDAAGATR